MNLQISGSLAIMWTCNRNHRRSFKRTMLGGFCKSFAINKCMWSCNCRCSCSRKYPYTVAPSWKVIGNFEGNQASKVKINPPPPFRPFLKICYWNYPISNLWHLVMINLQSDRSMGVCIPKKFDSHVNIKWGEKYTLWLQTELKRYFW